MVRILAAAASPVLETILRTGAIFLPNFREISEARPAFSNSLARIAAALSLPLPAAALAQAEAQPPAGHILVWSDEFDAPGLPDPAKWRYDTHRNAEGWYNDEAQYYAASRSENARVENGHLVIEARHEMLDKARFPDWGGQKYTSARLLSPEAGWRYGFFEVRAKLPCGRGSWPAIWMLPSGGDAPWPLGGEIDIMEHVGHDVGVVHGSVHTEAYNHVKGTHKTATVKVADVCGAFHRYQLRWTADRVEVGVDDKPYFSFANNRAGRRESWPFDRPFHLILNIAVGGFWGGAEGIDDAALPQRMEVDYVRVWQRGETAD